MKKAKEMLGSETRTDKQHEYLNNNKTTLILRKFSWSVETLVKTSPRSLGQSTFRDICNHHVAARRQEGSFRLREAVIWNLELMAAPDSSEPPGLHKMRSNFNTDSNLKTRTVENWTLRFVFGKYINVANQFRNLRTTKLRQTNF